MAPKSMAPEKSRISIRWSDSAGHESSFFCLRRFALVPETLTQLFAETSRAVDVNNISDIYGFRTSSGSYG